VRWAISGILDDAGVWVLRGDPRRRRARTERQRQRLAVFEELSFGAELLALCGLVVAQPVLDVFARSPEWFAYRGADAQDIVVFAALVTIAPPLLLWLVLAPTRLVGRPLRRGIHLVSLGALTALLLLQGLRGTLAWSPPLLVTVAFGLGALVAVLYPAVRALRSWILVLAVAPLVFVVLFLGNSATGDLVFASREVELAASPADAPVVILLLDELPTASLIDEAGDIDPIRYPNLAAFAQDATWYRNYTTQSGGTVNAVPALLSGKVPTGDPPFWFEHDNNLFTLLGASHKLPVWEVMTQLCAPSLCEGGGPALGDDDPGDGVVQGLLGDALDVWQLLIRPDDEAPDPQELFGENELARDSDQVSLVSEAINAGDEPLAWSELSSEIPAVSQPGRFRELLDALGEQDPGGAPGLYLAHILLPHQPWRFLPDGSTYPESQRPVVSEYLVHAESAPWHARVQRQRHILQTQYADALVGQLVERLEEVGLYDEALVVVVADHGAGFTPGQGLRVLGDGNATEIMWSPLLIKAPFQDAGVVTDLNAQLPDVVPTLADILGVQIPWSVDGRSLADVDGSERPDGEKQYVPFEDGGDRDHPRTMDGAAGLRAMLALTFDAAEGRADWVGAMYAGQPYENLVNVEVASLRVRTGAGPVARIDSLDEVLASEPAPHVNITGELDGYDGERGDMHLAVALNGHIVGVSPVERFGDIGYAFEVLAHPSWFVRGRQTVAVYQIVERRGAVELLQLEVRPS
jgi:hypothetical protein